MDKGIWVQSDFQEENEVLYFFHPVEGGGGQAYVSISNDGTIVQNKIKKLQLLGSFQN